MPERTVVVGAGLVGLLTAWELRRSGHDVTVISPDVGRDASYAAAGMLAPISEVQYGQQELWPIMTAARELYPQMLKTLAAATPEPTGYRDTCTVLLAYDRSDRDAVAELVSVLAEQGMDVEPMSSAQLRRHEPALAPGTSRGWAVPSDHQVDPRQLIRCVTAALNAEDLDAEALDGEWRAPGPRSASESAGSGTGAHAGAPVKWVYEQVASVHSSTEGAARDTGGRGSGVSVITQSGAVHQFDRAVLAPGLGYSGIEGLPRMAPLSLRPIHGDVLRLRVLPEQLLPGEKHLINSTLRARVGGRQVYLVPRADGGLVLGASSREDGLTGTHTGSVQELLDDAAAVVPGVKETELVEITTRARPGTPDERPYLGRIAPGVVVSTGYSRHGILLAPLAARLAAGLLPTGAAESLTEHERQLLRSMDPTRHTGPARHADAARRNSAHSTDSAPPLGAVSPAGLAADRPEAAVGHR